MKLYNLLFESVSKNEILQAIQDMMATDSATAKYLNSFLFLFNNDTTELAKSFYEQNKSQFNKALSQADTIKHLKGGSKGNAFSIGNQILKIELKHSETKFSAELRAEKSATDLFAKARKPKPKEIAAAPASVADPQDVTKPLKENIDDDSASIAPYVPMIYDQGTFKYPNPGGQEMTWVVMEKFEIPSGENKLLLNTLLNHLIQRFVRQKEPLDSIKDLENLPRQMSKIVDEITSNLDLKKDWFPNLIQAMWNLKHKGIADFHAGNLGVRRFGASHGWDQNPKGQGILVFFD